VVSGVLILLLPRIAGAESIWYAMLITEAAVAIYGVLCMMSCTKKLSQYPKERSNEKQ